MQQVAQLLQQYLERYAQEASGLKDLARDIPIGPEIFNRKRMAGHITCSALVLSPDYQSVLLIHHNVYQTWMQPGGHNEDAEPLFECAAREVLEETGVKGIRPVLLNGFPFVLDIDTHAIPARPNKNEGPHRHHDFLFLAIAKDAAALQHQVSETGGAQWASRRASNWKSSRLTRALQKLNTLDEFKVN